MFLSVVFNNLLSQWQQKIYFIISFLVLSFSIICGYNGELVQNEGKYWLETFEIQMKSFSWIEYWSCTLFVISKEHLKTLTVELIALYFTLLCVKLLLLNFWLLLNNGFFHSNIWLRFWNILNLKWTIIVNSILNTVRKCLQVLRMQWRDILDTTICKIWK